MKNAQAVLACAWVAERGLLLGRGRLRGLGALEDRVVAAGAGEQDRETDGGQHEDDGGVGGELGEKVRGTAWAKGGLRALAAEGSGEGRRTCRSGEERLR